MLELTEDRTKAWEGTLKELMIGLSIAPDGKAWTAKRLANALRRLTDVLPRAGLRGQLSSICASDANFLPST